MHRIDAAGFAAGNLFTDGNPSTGTPATVVDAAWLNDLQENIAQLVEATGIVLSKGDYTQMLKAIVIKGLQGCYFNIGMAAGTTDAISSSYTPAITALANGMALYVRAASVNATTTPTFTPNIGTIVAKQIVKGAGAVLTTGDIAGGGHWIEMQYDLILDKWILLNPATGVNSSISVAVQGAFKNLQASSSGISASVGVICDQIVLEDIASNYVTARNVNLTINSSASGSNGLDVGLLATSTWYSIWVIRRSDGITAGLLSTSLASPTLPSGFTHKARVGWVRTDSSPNKYPLAFKQLGRLVKYVPTIGSNVLSYPQIAGGVLGNTSTGNYVPASTNAFSPPTTSRIEIILLENSQSTILIAPNGNFSGYSGALSSFAPLSIRPVAAINTNISISGTVLLESNNIYVASDAASNLVAVVGWEDNL